MASTTVRVSFVCSSTTLTSIGVAASYANATDNFATVTQISTQSVSINSSGLTYSVSVSLPALAVNGVELAFALGAFTSGTFAITNVQLEPGPVATPFEQRPIGTELALCQRYCLSYGDFHVSMNGNTNAQGDGAFPVQMRASPTLNYTDASGVANQVTIWNGTLNSSTFLIGSLSVSTLRIVLDATTSFSSGTSSWLRAYNVKLSAEL